MPKKKAPELAGGGATKEKTLNIDFTTDEDGRQLSDAEIAEKMRNASEDFTLTQDEIDRMKREFDKWAEEAEELDYLSALEELEGPRDKDRPRVYWFILYPESCNPDWIKILQEMGLVGVISPLHNKDLWADGTPKKAHWHVILTYKGHKSFKQVQRVADACGGVRLRVVDNITGAVRYLGHLDVDPKRIASDKGKHVYPIDDYVPFGGFDYKRYIEATQEQVADALDHMYQFADDENIIYWDDFIRRARLEHPEWAFVMIKQSNLWAVHKFVQARHDRTVEAHAMAENKLLRREIQTVLTHIDGLTRLFTQIVTGEADVNAYFVGNDDES